MRRGLSIVDKTLLFRNKIVIPPSLQDQILSIAHEGHQGIVRTKQRLRQKVWWSGLNKDVEDFIRCCHGCQVVGALPNKTPVTMTPIPEDAWLMIGCDLCGPFPTGENLLVCIDYHSRYPEVEIMHKITSDRIAAKLRKLFCRYGAPKVIVTDNGPQFRKYTAFKALMNEFQVRHRKVTPYHPEANGEVERFNRNLKKTIQAAVAEGQNWRVVLDNYLLSYRTTPHATTGKTPAELMFGRQLRDKIPDLGRSKFSHSVKTDPIRRDRQKKCQAKEYTDVKNKAKSHNISIGNSVITTNTSKIRNKITPRWNTVPGTVVEVKGNSVVIDQGNKQIMRSASQVKQYHHPKTQPPPKT
jgi:ribosomal protein L21E